MTYPLHALWIIAWAASGFGVVLLAIAVAMDRAGNDVEAVLFGRPGLILFVAGLLTFRGLLFGEAL